MTVGQSSEVTKSNEIQPSPQVAACKAPGWRSGPLVGLCFALLAGLVVWLFVSAFHPVFTNTKDVSPMGILPPDKQWELDRNNSIFVLALLGGLAGAGLAFGEGLCRKSLTTALAAGMACVVAGAVFGGLAGYVGLRTFQHFETRLDLTDLDRTIRVYGVMLPMLGAGVGLGAGIFLGRSFGTAIKCLVAGALAGVLAAISYPVIVAMLIPGAITKVLIPIQAKEQLLWFALIAGLLGLIITAVARQGAGAQPAPDMTKGASA